MKNPEIKQLHWDEYEYDEKHDIGVFKKELVNQDTGEVVGTDDVGYIGVKCREAVSRDDYFAYLKWFLKNAA